MTPANARAASCQVISIHLCMEDMAMNWPESIHLCMVSHERSPDEVRLDKARPADARERRRQRPEGWPDVDGAKSVSRQFLLALPGHRRFPLAAVAQLARAINRSGYPGARSREGRTGPSEASHDAGLQREARPGPSHQVVGRRRRGCCEDRRD